MKTKQSLEQTPVENREGDALWKVEDVARFLRMARQSIYRAVSEKTIPFIKIGGAVRFDQEEIRKWLELKKTRFKGVRPS